MQRNRAVLFPTLEEDRGYGSRSAIVGLWMKNFSTWQHQVDKLMIDFNHDDHGTALTRMVKACPHEYIMFIEEDGIIIDPEFVDQCFKWVESGEYDAVGSPRGCTEPELISAAATQFSNTYESLAPGHGFALWPNFFFCKKTDLLKTDLNFNAYLFKAGVHIPEINYTPPRDMNGDTMVWMSMQLRALGLRIKEVEQHHGNPDDLDHFQNRTGLFKDPIPWIHFGSFSGNYGPAIDTATSKEYERRLMWMELAGINMDHIVQENGYDRARIEAMKNIYKQLLKGAI